MGGGASKRSGPAGAPSTADFLSSRVHFDDFVRWHSQLVAAESSAADTMAGVTGVSPEELFERARSVGVITASRAQSTTTSSGSVLLEQLMGHLVLDNRALKRQNVDVSASDASAPPAGAAEGQEEQGRREEQAVGVHGLDADWEELRERLKEAQSRADKAEAALLLLRDPSTKPESSPTPLQVDAAAVELAERLKASEAQVAALTEQVDQLRSQASALDVSASKGTSAVRGSGAQTEGLDPPPPSYDDALDLADDRAPISPPPLQETMHSATSPALQGSASIDPSVSYGPADKGGLVKPSLVKGVDVAEGTGSDQDAEYLAGGGAGYSGGEWMSPRDVVAVVEELKWILSQTDLDLAQLLARYSSDPAGKIDKEQMGQALGGAPVSLRLSPGHLSCLWNMILRAQGPVQEAARNNGDVLSDGELSASPLALPQPLPQDHVAAVQHDEQRRAVGTDATPEKEVLEVEVVARSLVGDHSEPLEHVVAVLHKRLALKNATLLQLFRAERAAMSAPTDMQLYSGISPGISYAEFRAALGVGGSQGIDLSEARLKTLWQCACEASLNLAPALAQAPDLFGGQLGGGVGVGGVVLDVRDVALRLDVPAMSEQVLQEQMAAADLTAPGICVSFIAYEFLLLYPASRPRARETRPAQSLGPAVRASWHAVMACDQAFAGFYKTSVFVRAALWRALSWPSAVSPCISASCASHLDRYAASLSREELERALRHQQTRANSTEIALGHNRHCMAIAVRRLKAVDLEAQALRRRLATLSPHAALMPHAGGAALLGPILEGGRVGTPTEARGVLSQYDAGGVIASDTLALGLVSVVLEEAIHQLDAYNTSLKRPPPRARAPGGARRQRENLLPHQADTKLTRDNRTALQQAAAAMDDLVVDALARACHSPLSRPTTIRVYLAAHADDFESERRLLTPALTPMRTALQQAGHSLVLIDHRTGCSEAKAGGGAQLDAGVTSTLSQVDGWQWTEVLAGRSLTEAEITCALRCIYSEDAASTRRCMVYVKEEDANDAGVVVEDEERQVRQRQLLDDILSHRASHCHTYSTAAHVTNQVSSTLMRLIHKDVLVPVDRRYSRPSPGLPPFGTGQTQAALQVVAAARSSHVASTSPSVEELKRDDVVISQLSQGSSVTDAPGHTEHSTDANSDAESDRPAAVKVLMPGDAYFWDHYLGLQSDAQSGVDGAEGEQGQGKVGRTCGKDGQPDWQRVLDRYLFFVAPSDSGQAGPGGGDGHLMETGPPPLVLAGPSGSGKTAVLRRWCGDVCARTEPRIVKVLSYLGTDSSEPQPVTALYHIMCEIKAKRLLAPSDHVRLAAPAFATALLQVDAAGAGQARSLDGPGAGAGVLYGRRLPLVAQDVLDSFPEWIKVSGSRHQMLLVLDCMDQMTHPAKRAPWARPQDLHWLPTPSPHVRVVLSLRVEEPGMIAPDSAGGDESMEALRCFKRWRWPVVELKALSVMRREALASYALGRHSAPLLDLAAVITERGDGENGDTSGGESGRRLSVAQRLHGDGGGVLGGALARVLGLGPGGGVGLGEGAETLAGGVTVLTRMCDGMSLELAASSFTMHQLCDWLLLFWEAVMDPLRGVAGGQVHADGAMGDGGWWASDGSSGSSAAPGGGGGVVSGGLSLLLVARHGLSVQDLTALLRVPPLTIARFLYVMGGAGGGLLEEWGGRYFVTSRPIREAATRAYFIAPPGPTPPETPKTSSQPQTPTHAIAALSFAAEQAAGGGKATSGRGGGEVWARLALVHYLGDPLARQPLLRVAGEVPYHLLMLQSWSLLRDVVCSMPVFLALWSHAQGVRDLIRYWSSEALGAHYDAQSQLVTHLDAFIIASLPRLPPNRAERAETQRVHSQSEETGALASDSLAFTGRTGLSPPPMPAHFEDWVAEEGLQARRAKDGESVRRALTGGELLEHIAAVARFLHMQQHVPAAQGLYGRGARLAHALYGPGHARTVGATREQASALFDLHDFESALAAVENSLVFCTKLPVLLITIPPPPQAQEGGVLPEEATALVVRISGLETEDASACIELRARVLRALGQYQVALDNFKRAVSLNQLHMYRRTVAALQRKMAPAAAESTAPSLDTDMEDDEGSMLLASRDAVQPEEEGSGSQRTAQMYAKNLVSLADALVEVNREDYMPVAEAIMQRAGQVLSRQLGPLHADIADLALVPLADLQGKGQGRWLDAAQTLLRARSILLSSLPSDHRRVEQVTEQLNLAQAQVMVASKLRDGPTPVNAYIY